MDYILNQALTQVEAGADILDVNVGLPEVDEEEMMVRAVKAIQGVCDAPLQLDSTDPKVLERALRVYCGKAIVNSVNGDRETMEAILPLVKKYGAAVVGLTLDKDGIPKTAQQRVDIARRILEAALSYGIRREDVYIDCLTLTASAEQEGASQTLDALRRVKDELGLKTVLGVSNISFGLPARPLVNQTFLTMAMTCRPGPAHPQPQHGCYDGRCPGLPPADECGSGGPCVYCRLRKRRNQDLHYLRRGWRPDSCTNGGPLSGPDRGGRTKG